MATRMDPVNALALGRVVIGSGMLFAPEVSLRVGLLDASAVQAPLLARLFGSREIALGTLTLLAPASQKRAMVSAGVAVDAADAVAAVVAVRTGSVSRLAGGALTGVALAAVATGLSGLAGRGSATP